MLCQFTVKNFKSIRDEATFDMQATAISEHTDRIIVDTDGEKYLPISAIYGPNGGGKSNVLASLRTLRLKVLRPLWAVDDSDDQILSPRKVIVEPFAFSECRDQPTEFELFFRTSAAEYRYVLHIKRDVILYESLDRIKLETKRCSPLFTRDEDGVSLKGDLSSLKVSRDLSQTLPLLSYLGITFKENDVVKDVMNWFEYRIVFLNYGNPIQETQMAASTSNAIKPLILDMIHELDLNIVDFRIEKTDTNKIKIFTTHRVNDVDTELSLSDESSGTKKIFGLLPYIAQSLITGSTLVIDELDAKLHPQLLRHIIMLFNDMSVNTHKAQLIFTSHDLSTMNNEVFRRDEIWFVAKGNEENSKLYSLVEFKNESGNSIRKDAKFDKQYLEGKYGADPYLQKIIDWRFINA